MAQGGVALDETRRRVIPGRVEENINLEGPHEEVGRSVVHGCDRDDRIMHAAPQQRAEGRYPLQIDSLAGADDKSDANGPVLDGEIDSRHRKMKW